MFFPSIFLVVASTGVKAKNFFTLKFIYHFCGTLSSCLSAQHNVFSRNRHFFNQIKIINFCFSLTQGLKRDSDDCREGKCVRFQVSTEDDSDDGLGSKSSQSPVDSLSSALIIHLRSTFFTTGLCVFLLLAQPVVSISHISKQFDFTCQIIFPSPSFCFLVHIGLRAIDHQRLMIL